MSFRYILILLGLLADPVALTAQGPKNGQDVINTVYNSLNEAIGINQLPPKLVIKETQEFLAQLVPSKKEIQIEWAAYEVCRTMGADSLNALAFILGHELAHHYRNHKWLSEAGTGFASEKLKDKLESLDIDISTSILYETEADVFGSYYAKKAGFSISVADTLLTKLYKAYGLPSSISARYPDLSERIAIANKVLKKTTQLNDVYNISGFLYITQHYRSSAALLNHILSSEIHPREVYNNIGGCYIRMGLAYADDETNRLMVPLTMDAYSRLEDRDRSGRYDSLKALEYFNKAAAVFNLANNLDDKYINSKINTAIACLLTGSYKKAANKLDEASDLTLGSDADNSVTKSKIEYIRVLLSHFQANKSKQEILLVLSKQHPGISAQSTNMADFNIDSSQPITLTLNVINTDSLFNQFTPLFFQDAVYMPVIGEGRSKIKFKELNDIIYIQTELKGTDGFNAIHKIIKVSKTHPQFKAIAQLVDTSTKELHPDFNHKIAFARLNGGQTIFMRKGVDGHFEYVYLLK